MKSSKMRVFGIDPGIAITGWGIVDFCSGRGTAISYGSVLTDKDLSVGERLSIMYDDLFEIINQFSPDVMAIEKLFFFKNAKTIIPVGEARGVTLLVANKSNLPIYEYTPLQIKQAMTGYGRAKKNQVQEMVKTLFGLDSVPKPDDVADALAVAYTYSVYMNS